MQPPKAALVAVWVLAAAACSEQSDNPFAGRERMVPPPESAILLFTSSGWTTSPGAGREVYAVNADGSEVTRLTYCNTETEACDNLEVAASSDRMRIMARRIRSSDPAEAMVYVDLARSVQSTLVPSSRKVSSIDWPPNVDFVFYSGLGAGGIDDVYRIDYNGQNEYNISGTTESAERDPRVDPFGTQVALTSSDASGLGIIERITSTGIRSSITAGGEPGLPLSNVPWIVGSDTDPAFSPDAEAIVFRRATSRGRDGRGHWDILTVAELLGPTSVVASGPLYRGEPDWGPSGIAFFEEDSDAGVSRLVLVGRDGTNRRVLLTLPLSVAVGPPRFLAAR
jgi:Tol biopolymer transport system component